MDDKQRVTLAEKASYLLTSYGYTSISSAISIFILYYYTDVALLDTAVVSGLLFIVRLFDGAIDPFIGHYMDSHRTKHGKYRGYLMNWALPFCIVSVLVFVAPPSGGAAVKIGWYACTYLIWSFIYSIIEAANLSLLVVITDDAAQRYAVNSAKIIGGILASLAARYFALELVDVFGGGDEARGFALTASVFAGVGFLCIQLPARHIVERNTDAKKPPSLLRTMAALLKDRRVLFMLLFFFAHQMGSSVKGQASVYYMKYIVNQPSLTAAFLMTSSLSSLAMQPLISLWAKRVSNRILIAGGYLGGALGMMVMGLAGTSVPLLFAGNILYGVAVAFPANLLYVYVAELSTTTVGSTGATLHSLLGVAAKLAVALGGSLIALVLSFSDYIPNLAQGADSQAGIKFAFITVTLALYIAAAVLALLSFGSKGRKE